MKIYRRGESYYYDFTVEGRRTRGTCGPVPHDLAKQIAQKAYVEAVRIGTLKQKRYTWKEASAEYLARSENLKTYKWLKGLLSWWDEVLEKNRIRYLDEIDEARIAPIRLAELARPKKDGAKRSVIDVNRKVGALRAVVNAAYRKWRWVQGEPPLIAMAGPELERKEWLTAEEVNRLIQQLRPPLDQMVLFSVATGLRKRNVLDLRWSEVDLGRRIIRIPAIKMKNGDDFSLPINEAALGCLRKMWGDHPEWVFTRNGKKFNVLPLREWYAALEKAGLQGHRWHDLRHTFASLLRINGVTLDRIQELGGWKDEKVVHRYAALSVDHLREDSSVLDGALSQIGHSTPQNRTATGS